MNTDQLFLDYIGESISTWEIQYRVHAVQRMFNRNIDEVDILTLLGNGTIIEFYQDDYPFPSMLVNGIGQSFRPLHVVVGIDKINKRLYVITTYEPDASKWQVGFTRRIS